jgi:hypothetical protein
MQYKRHTNVAVAGSIGEDGRVDGAVSHEELEALDAEQLPDREQLSLVNANVAIPINAAIAANVLSDNAVAWANAAQDAAVGQGT